MDGCTCRICLETSPTGLISPCAGCRGSSAFVHWDCLVCYYSSQEAWWDLHCPTCKHPYEGQAAVDLAMIGLQKTVKRHGKKSLDAAAMQMSLGVAHQKLRASRENMKLQESALAIIEEVAGRDHILAASALTNLANAHGELGDTQLKKELLERALAIQRLQLGPKHRDVAITLVNLGTACGMLGDRLKMRDMLQIALAAFEMDSRSNHREIASTLVNLGGVHGDLGEHTKMKELLERSLALSKLQYGHDHLHNAYGLTSLACANAAMGLPQEARAQCAEALRIVRVSCQSPSAAAAEVCLVCAGTSRALSGSAEGSDGEASAAWQQASIELKQALGEQDARAKLDSVVAELRVFWDSARKPEVVEWLGENERIQAAKRRRLNGKQRVS
eukprot:TRINITY_DN53734_c0_g1_i1.p1 TRINITY_DN53734_c0_g1~~TRINITY_DN53734_c0_g1_i1.p1  ORF type:complete len:389 (+),score=74.80 TRINITY_DN53734_c0_g1_i1:34-1200(+)